MKTISRRASNPGEPSLDRIDGRQDSDVNSAATFLFEKVLLDRADNESEIGPRASRSSCCFRWATAAPGRVLMSSPGALP